MKPSTLLPCVSIFFIFSLCFLQISGHASEADQSELKSAECKAEYFLIDELNKQFSQEHNVKHTISRVGNKVGIKLLAAEKIDFAFLSMPPHKLIKKLKLDSEKTKNWKVLRIAKSPIVVVINRNNPLSDISHGNLKKIYKGIAGNWSELGGHNTPIKIATIAPNVESGIRIDFKHATVGMMGKLTEKGKEFLSPKSLGAYVAQNDGGITFMALNSHRDRYGKIASINGVKPDRSSILNGSYPLATTYYLVYHGENETKLKPFLDYVTGEKGQSIISKEHIVDIVAQ